MIKKKYKKGFTLVEVLSASAILLFVLLAVYSTYLMLYQIVRDTSTQAILQGKARLAVERMINDIRLASEITCPAAGTYITLKYNPAKMGGTGSSWSARYRLSGGQILYSPNISTTSEISIINKVDLGSKKLFQYDGGAKLVTVDLKVKNITLTTTQDSHLTTIVRVRNAN